MSVISKHHRPAWCCWRLDVGRLQRCVLAQARAGTIHDTASLSSFVVSIRDALLTML